MTFPTLSAVRFTMQMTANGQWFDAEAGAEVIG
jgi:hypothetical protein